MILFASVEFLSICVSAFLREKAKWKQRTFEHNHPDFPGEFLLKQRRIREIGQKKGEEQNSSYSLLFSLKKNAEKNHWKTALFCSTFSSLAICRIFAFTSRILEFQYGNTITPRLLFLEWCLFNNLPTCGPWWFTFAERCANTASCLIVNRSLEFIVVKEFRH